MAQRVRVRDGAADDAQVRVAGVMSAGGDEGQALAREAAAAQDQIAPLPAAFPVAVVRGVVAKAEKDGEGKAHQRERRRREMQLVVAELAVGPGHEHRQQRREREVHPDARQDRSAHDEKQAQGRGTVADDHVRLPAWSSMKCMRGMVVYSGLRARKRPIHISYVRHDRSGESGFARLGHRPGLHGHERLLRESRRRGIHRDDPARHRPRRHPVRHGRHVRPAHERGIAGPRDPRPARGARHRHQVRHHADARESGRFRRLRPARIRARRVRGQPEAPRHRHHRPVLPAPGGPGHAHRGHDGRAGGPRPRRQGALRGPVRGVRPDDRAGGEGPSGDGAAERVFAVDARPGGTGRRAGRVPPPWHRLRALQPAGPRLPDGRDPHAGRLRAGRLPPRQPALPGRELRAQHRPRRQGARAGARGGLHAGPAGARVGAGAGAGHRADPRHQAPHLPRGERGGRRHRRRAGAADGAGSDLPARGGGGDALGLDLDPRRVHVRGRHRRDQVRVLAVVESVAPVRDVDDLVRRLGPRRARCGQHRGHARVVVAGELVVHDVVVRVEHHRHPGAHAHVVDLVRAVRVLVVLQAQAQADRVRQRADALDEGVGAVGLAAVDLEQCPRRARLFQQVHEVGVHLQDFHAVGDDVGRVGTEHHELVRMHHEAQPQFRRAPARARERGREGLHDGPADVFVEEREDRRRDAVQPDAVAAAILQRAVQRLQVVAVELIQQPALAVVRQLQQALARDGAVADVLRDGDADEAELGRRRNRHDEGEALALGRWSPDSPMPSNQCGAETPITAGQIRFSRTPGERDGERAAAPRAGAGGVDVAAVQFDELAHEGEAQAQAALRAVERARGLREQVEHDGQQVGADAVAVVAHGEEGLAVGGVQFHLDVAALRRVLGRVGEQVRDHLHEARVVAVHRHGHVGQPHVEAVAARVDERADLFGGFRDDAAQVGRLLGHGDEPARDARHVQQVVHDVAHVRDLARDDVADLLHARLARICQAQHVGRAGDRRQRIAQLVRQHGEEFVLAPVGQLQGFFRALAFRDVDGDDVHDGAAAVRAEAEAAAHVDPREAAVVGAADARRGAVFAARADGLFDRVAQRPAVVRMDELLQLGDVAPVLAEHAVQVGREADVAGVRIALPHGHARGDEALLQAFLAVAYGPFGPFQRGDVGAGAEPLDDLAGVVAQRRHRREEAAVAAVRAAQREGHLRHVAAGEGFLPAPHHLRQDLGIVVPVPFVGAGAARRAAGELVPAVVEPHDVAVRAGNPHELRDVVRELQELAALRFHAGALFVQAVEHAVQRARQADDFARAFQRGALGADVVAQAGGKGLEAAQVAREPVREPRREDEHDQRQQARDDHDEKIVRTRRLQRQRQAALVLAQHEAQVGQARRQRHGHRDLVPARGLGGRRGREDGPRRRLEVGQPHLVHQGTLRRARALVAQQHDAEQFPAVGTRLQRGLFVAVLQPCAQPREVGRREAGHAVVRDLLALEIREQQPQRDAVHLAQAVQERRQVGLLAGAVDERRREDRARAHFVQARDDGFQVVADGRGVERDFALLQQGVGLRALVVDQPERNAGDEQHGRRRQDRGRDREAARQAGRGGIVNHVSRRPALERIAHGLAVGAAGTLDGLRQDVREVVRVGDADRAPDVLDAAHLRHLRRAGEEALDARGVGAEEAEGLDHGQVDLLQRRSRLRREVAARHAPVAQDRQALRLRQCGHLAHEDRGLVVVGDEQDGLRARGTQVLVIVDQARVAPVVPRRPDDLQRRHPLRRARRGLGVAAPPGGVGQQQADMMQAAPLRRLQQLGHGERIAQRQAEHVVRTRAVVDDDVGRRPRRHERQVRLAQGRQFLDDDGAEAAAEHGDEVRHRREFLDVADAARGDRTVVLRHHLQRPAAQHAARRVDLGDGRAHAQFDRLGRRRIVQSEFAVDPQQHRLRRGRVRRPPRGRQQQAGQRQGDQAPAAGGERRVGCRHDNPREANPEF
ncbi:hypothetical protein Lal_00015019 [Lupinus albus]|nr:hypothetical protein Lal_00015019 [Lupinus albus]